MAISFDGNWIDISSILVASAYAAYKKRKLTITKWTDRRLAFHLANGLGLFPVMILALGVFSKGLLNELVEANRATLFIAGAFALMAMLDD